MMTSSKGCSIHRFSDTRERRAQSQKQKVHNDVNGPDSERDNCLINLNCTAAAESSKEIYAKHA